MKLSSPSQQQGNYFENLAVDFLQEKGLILVAKNWHCRFGELDLIMLDNSQHLPCLVIVEVRQRKMSDFSSVLETITPSKQRKIIKATEQYLLENPQFNEYEIRFDVVAFTTDKNQQNSIEWLPSAFLVNDG